MSGIYDQLREYLLHSITTGQLAYNAKLPAERQLSEKFSSTRITLREALFRLESEALIYRLNRKGWFVAPPRFIIDPSCKADFTCLAEDQGRMPKTLVLQLKKIKAKLQVREQLQLGKGSSVFEVIRLRYLDGRPIMMEKIYLDAVAFGGIQHLDLNRSITAVQREHFNADIVKESLLMRIEALGEAQASVLEVPPSMPCLMIERVRFQDQEKPLDFNQEFWLHNAFEMHVSAMSH